MVKIVGAIVTLWVGIVISIAFIQAIVHML
jgi:hypothetical protein